MHLLGRNNLNQLQPLAITAVSRRHHDTEPRSRCDAVHVTCVKYNTEYSLNSSTWVARSSSIDECTASVQLRSCVDLREPSAPQSSGRSAMQWRHDASVAPRQGACAIFAENPPAHTTGTEWRASALLWALCLRPCLAWSPPAPIPSLPLPALLAMRECA